MQIKINGKKIEAKKGETILEVAIRNKIKIPNLCYHSDIKPSESCRLCIVEIKGRDGYFTSCSTLVEDGMDIKTNTKEIKKLRKTNLELLFSQHIEKCCDCNFTGNCRMLELAEEMDVDIYDFQDRKKGFKEYKFGPALKYDSSKCIDCNNCLEVCPTKHLTLKREGSFYKIKPSQKDKCVYCGQCLVHCPVQAFESVDPSEKIEKAIKNKYVVFQFAPAIRTSIGEAFNMKTGSVLTEQLVGAIKELGVKKVFDTSFGADITIMEEGGEIIERLEKNKNLPIFTSCCPAWVRYLELFYPEFLSNLATSRSPQIILGGVIKTYFAKKEKINPKDIVVVSVMPCTAKKFEITRKQFRINGLDPVDYVITTSEIAKMFKRRKIDLKKIKPQKADNPLGEVTGAGVIFGSSGGVSEAALRTVYNKLTGKNIGEINFIRGEKGVKRAEIELNGRKVKICVVDGLKNVESVLKELKKNPHAYDVVEVMSCPGGCIGGGGQIVPVDKKVRAKRAKGLYDIDNSKKIKMSHENPLIKKIYKEYLNKHHYKICHTTYAKRKDNIH